MTTLALRTHTTAFALHTHDNVCADERCTTTLHDGKTKRSVRVHKQNERARKRAKRTQ